jgi:hypothetical protein
MCFTPTVFFPHPPRMYRMRKKTKKIFFLCVTVFKRGVYLCVWINRFKQCTMIFFFARALGACDHASLRLTPME